MRVILAALVFAPFIAWYAVRAIRAVKSGVYDSLTGPVDRESQPAWFWFWVIHQLLFLSALVVAFGSVLFALSAATLMWTFAGYVSAYIAIVVMTLVRARPQSNQPLERPGSAGRSASDR